jgi:hypothetical protein
MNSNPEKQPVGVVDHPKRAWTAPVVKRIRAGEAENSPVANREDGSFSQGS